jgi:hypothetical protein
LPADLDGDFVIEQPDIRRLLSSLAAVLGNAQNRSAFRNSFWWDSDLGMSTYLAHAGGTPQLVEINDPNSDVVQTRPPLIVTEEDAPRDHREALQRWQRARKSFVAALDKSRKAQSDLSAVYELLTQMPEIAQNLAVSARQLEQAQNDRQHTLRSTDSP